MKTSSASTGPEVEDDLSVVQVGDSRRIAATQRRRARTATTLRLRGGATAGFGIGRGPAYNPQGFPPGAYGPNGPMMQGTLAFPHQPFIRSPRDYFMLDLNK